MPRTNPDDLEYELDFGFRTVAFELYKEPLRGWEYYKVRTSILWTRFLNRWLFFWRRKEFDAELKSILRFAYAGADPNKTHPNRISAIKRIKPLDNTPKL